MGPPGSHPRRRHDETARHPGITLNEGAWKKACLMVYEKSRDDVTRCERDGSGWHWRALFADRQPSLTKPQSLLDTRAGKWRQRPDSRQIRHCSGGRPRRRSDPVSCGPAIQLPASNQWHDRYRQRQAHNLRMVSQRKRERYRSTPERRALPRDLAKDRAVQSDLRHTHGPFRPFPLFRWPWNTLDQGAMDA